VALPKIGFNEGSMLRRIVLHVATFVLGSVAFIGITSLILVSIASHLVAPADPTAADDEPALAGSAMPRVPHTTSTKPASRLHKRGGATPAPAVTAAAQAGTQND
jgi:hypothetical protein